MMSGQGHSQRQGLPRVPGGAPWPPLTTNDRAAVTSEVGEIKPQQAPQTTATELSDAAPEPTERAVPLALAVGSPQADDLSAMPPPASVDTPVAVGDGMVAVRRGLPRIEGGERWPSAVTVSAFFDVPTSPLQTDSAAAVEPEPAAAIPALTEPSRAFTAPAAPVVEATEARRYGRYTTRQWVGGGVVVIAAAVALVAVVVAVARWLLSLDAVSDFVAQYPGEYHLPEGAPVGIPVWLAWQHFFNAFFILLIIRSGWGVRTQKKPPAYWTSSRNPASKVSLTVWFHQSLDLLWLINGVLFAVLLFVTGQWMRVVPTSWEVFPNAISVALQYASLDWPTENGWVNYNSLQQLAYFATIFVAAPLAIATGFRMSTLWPTKAARLTKAYPIKWARALHFPVMLYFIVFIVIHVALVLSTGALRNLNHMYAAQGSTDPTAFADNWTGFWMFIVSLVVIVGAWAAARPIVLAPIARLFGTVSAR